MSYSTLAIIFIVDAFSICFCIYFIREILQLRKTPPFIPTRAGVVQEIVQHMGPIPSGSFVYDLGCGDGRILTALAVQNPDARYIGIEFRLLPLYLAKFRARNLPQVSFLRENIFIHDIHDADYIYTYLYPHVMDTLLPKFEKQLKKGAKLYSLDFILSKKVPVHEFTLSSSSEKQLARRLFAYTF